MSERITNNDIEKMTSRLNGHLSPQGLQVDVNSRYNYLGIDLYKQDGSMSDTLRTGLTKREAYEFLYAMCRGIELVAKGY